MKPVRLLFVAFLPLLLSAAGPATVSGVDTSAMDKKVDPCVDFYQYACGSWIANNPLPADRSRYGRFETLRERNEAVLLDIVQGAAAKGAAASETERKIGNHFAACMDTASIEKKGLAPVKADLDRIRAIRGEEELMEQIGLLHVKGVPVVFLFGAAPDMKDSGKTIGHLTQGGLSMPDRDYYLKTDEKSVEIRKKFEAHVAKMFKLAGFAPDAAASAARSVLEFETVIAKASMERAALRDPKVRYNPVTLAQLAAMTPEVPWENYFAAVGAPRFEGLNIMAPSYIKKVAADLRGQSLDAWKVYFSYHVLRSASSHLPAAFDEEAFDFYGRTVAGTKEQRPRVKRCVEAVDAHLGDLLGQKYIEVAFGGASKEKITEMVNALEKALEKDIEALPWMSAETKKAAVAKLHAITNNVGTPKKWRDYSAVTIARDDYHGNAQRASEASHKRNIVKIGKPTDRTEWGMTTPTVNAFYNPSLNSINFPAGILQFPFFDAQRDAAANFGGIGAVIGHELTHGFDDSGRKFDAQGNLRDWWTAQDGAEFEKRAACVANQYSTYTAVGDVKLNGKLTLGENVADHGGVRVALMALLDTLGGKTDKLDGFSTDQRFFLGFAQLWCQNASDEQSRLRALTDPHSPGKYRVNGTVQNMPEFQKAFSCKAGQPMVSSNACRVW
jgi:endothelin-converting enzyme/putative endopeptidase